MLGSITNHATESGSVTWIFAPARSGRHPLDFTLAGERA
jgi:hypothetical protein